MVELELWRYNSNDDATIGIMLERRTDTWRRLCFTCEDEYRLKKVARETRISAGRYRITLRTAGGMSTRYATRFGSMHKGMLWLQDVPGFSWIYIHIGNDDDDSEGCILVGESTNETALTIQQSTSAYKRVYRQLARAITDGEEVWLTIRDLDRPVLPTPPE